MTTLTLMRGYPASGKSTIAGALSSQTNAPVVCRDDIRKMMYGKYWGVDEDSVTVTERAAVKALLKAGQSVIVDAQHVNPEYIKQWAKVASEHGAELQIHDVPTAPDICVYRDKLRERQVGEGVIRKAVKRFPISKWKPVESFRVKPIVVEPVEWVEGLPQAVIVDIDGTLTMGPNGRSPYDYSKVKQDKPNVHTIEVLRQLYWSESAPMVFIMSGRDDSCRDDTAEWLIASGVDYNYLLMRPADLKDSNGNKLPDWIVKLNLFNEHIRGKYNVRMVFDDRNQVVDMWRALGLTCAQVAPGDF